MRLLVFLLSWIWMLPLLHAASPTEVADQALLARKLTNNVLLTPGPDDTNITRIVAAIMERSNYLKQRLNTNTASKFLDRYLDTLDSLHLYFLQSDVREWDGYRAKLATMTQEGDTRPADMIFQRFIERVHQQYDYVTNLLQTAKFEFNTDETYLPNRKDQPRPKDLTEARQLWRERLRYEYLQEKLSMGRPDELVKLIAEQLERNKPEGVLHAIQDKMSKERAQEIAKVVEQQAGQTPREELLKDLGARLEKDNTDEIVKALNRRYTRLLRFFHEFDGDDVLQIYLTALTRVYDPHSDYMGHGEMENFAISMKLSLFGIGALLRSEDGYCKIQSLTPNGPAEKSKKLKPNDKIIAVAQSNQPPVEVIETKLSKVVEMIRGPKGTEVRLTIIPADAPNPTMRKVVSLTRDEIKLEDQAAKAKLFEVPGDKGQNVRVGVIDLPSFYSSEEMEAGKSGGNSTTLDVAKLIRKLVSEKVDGIVLDLRHNGGGFLPEAIRLSGLFIKEGPVVQVKTPDGEVRVEEDPDPKVFYDGPLVVLTSRMSASASEILAGAIQDYGRGVVVGDISTHGKGTVQTVLKLRTFMRGHMAVVTSNDPGAIKVTVSKFYRPSGASTQLRGVVPDIVLPSVFNHAEIGESSLENPLPWDTIDKAPFEPLNRVEPVLPELKSRSEKRLASNPDFAYVREEVERYKKSVAEKTVSLNEAKRLKEKQEFEARAQARKKELAARAEPPGKTYEITLKLANEPGLPPPLTRTNSVKIAGAKSGGQPVAPAPQAAPSAQAESPRATQVAQAGDSPAVPKLEDGEEAEDDKTPAVDYVLDETRRILLDYISLSRDKAALANTSGK